MEILSHFLEPRLTMPPVITWADTPSHMIYQQQQNREKKGERSVFNIPETPMRVEKFCQLIQKAPKTVSDLVLNKITLLIEINREWEEGRVWYAVHQAVSATLNLRMLESNGIVFIDPVEEEVEPNGVEVKAERGEEKKEQKPKKQWGKVLSQRAEEKAKKVVSQFHNALVECDDEVSALAAYRQCEQSLKTIFAQQQALKNQQGQRINRIKEELEQKVSPLIEEWVEYFFRHYPFLTAEPLLTTKQEVKEGFALLDQMNRKIETLKERFPSLVTHPLFRQKRIYAQFVFHRALEESEEEFLEEDWEKIEKE